MQIKISKHRNLQALRALPVNSSNIQVTINTSLTQNLPENKQRKQQQQYFPTCSVRPALPKQQPKSDMTIQERKITAHSLS